MSSWIIVRMPQYDFWWESFHLEDLDPPWTFHYIFVLIRDLGLNAIPFLLLDWLLWPPGEAQKLQKHNTFSSPTTTQVGWLVSLSLSEEKLRCVLFQGKDTSDLVGWAVSGLPSPPLLLLPLSELQNVNFFTRIISVQLNLPQEKARKSQQVFYI